VQTDALAKVRINLARSNCVSLRITTEATLTKDTLELIGLDPKRKFIRFYEQYSRSNVQHYMQLRFVQREKQEDQYGIRLLYETEETGGVIPIPRASSKKTLKPSEVFLSLCSMKDSFLFHCYCSFLYSREDKEEYFLLPIKVDYELFDEVRGIRFVKLQDDKILWENSLDLFETDLMIHRIKFVHEGKCSTDLPQKLLKQAKVISRKT
jgi:hypothetical protein